jgi:hypothetical protein
MGADNQAERVIERMERERALVTAAIRLLRALKRDSTVSTNAFDAMLDLERAIALCGYHIEEEPPP